ncbi:hypothetical protein KUCAC02_020546 [Chaenocephalus aceratus]|nr:hypothetical protein KUCAC02_020546 [Chaenocephalus aceratus]
MLDFGDGPVPYIGGPEAYHFGRRSFPFGAIKSVQKGGQTGSNPAAPGGLYDRPDPYGGEKPVSIKIAPSGRVDGPVPFGGDTQGYPVTKKGETGRSTADGPVPYGSASHYTNADPTKDGQSGNQDPFPVALLLKSSPMVMDFILLATWTVKLEVTQLPQVDSMIDLIPIVVLLVIPMLILCQ